MTRSPIWIAQRHGQDWRDQETLDAIHWLTGTIPSSQWNARLDRARANFEASRKSWAAGQRVSLYNEADTIAWYVLQAQAYAAERHNWVEHEAYRIAPLFRRLGQMLPVLRAVSGIEERVERLMSSGRSTPDSGIYELLVAGAYASRGWRHVSFVREKPGIARTPDLSVATGRRKWAVECKRVGRSGYAFRERQAGEAIAAKAHEECDRRGLSLNVQVIFATELDKVDDTYLATQVAEFAGRRPRTWKDDISRGQISLINWRPIQSVLKHDDVYFGSSRMIELLVGEHQPMVDHSVSGNWTPAIERPFHATSMTQASVVRWFSASEAAAHRKATHFRSMVADAEQQLPDDCPGVVHVGYEAIGGNSVDGQRHRRNSEQIATFKTNGSRLKWVYGNYMTPEHTVARNESSALSETTAVYQVGRRTHTEPLRSHMLFVDEQGRPGNHWYR